MAKRKYMAYLLRLWREKEGDSWRAFLENPSSGERAGFGTLVELVAYLEAKTGEAIPSLPINVTRPEMAATETEHAESEDGR